MANSVMVEAEWSIDRHLALTVAYVRFFKGPVVEDAGGRDVDFFGAWLVFKF